MGPIVTLAACRSLPVYPCERTSSDRPGMSHTGPNPDIVSTTPRVIGIALLVRHGDAIWTLQHPLRPAIATLFAAMSARIACVLLAQAAKTKRVPV
jgi:hypothetical protein